jgi:glutaredoxin
VTIKLPEDPTFLDVAGATHRQREYYQAYLQAGTIQGAGKILGVAHQNLYTAFEKLLRKAADRGWTENRDLTAFVPPGQVVTGLSTLTKDEDGNTVWVKTKKEMEDQKEAFRAFVDEICAEIKPRKRSKAAKKRYDKTILPTIVIGDAHIGMRSDQEYTRDREFNADIAQKEILDAIDYLVDCSPEAEKSLLVAVGDLMHFDNSAKTTTRGTPQSASNEYEIVLRKVAKTMIHGITRMLEKHKTVYVAVAKGNHDWDSAAAIQLALECYFEKEPRVKMVDQRGAFQYLTFGSNLIAINHGDRLKPERLAAILPREQPQAWAETTHRYWLLGHFHTQAVMECDNGVIIERHATLAPGCSWHSEQGYKSASIMTCIVYRVDGGKMATYQYEIPQHIEQVDVKIG